jgi:cell division FtsZ-interacting protein ZapD
MGSAALKSQASRDEADIRALIKTIDKAHRDKDAAAIVARMRKTRLFAILRSRFPIGGWISK